MNVSQDNAPMDYMDYFTNQLPKNLATMAALRDELAVRRVRCQQRRMRWLTGPRRLMNLRLLRPLLLNWSLEPRKPRRR